jgi:1-acyl-sn-glycerol-3-phosphate acyltransferase
MSAVRSTLFMVWALIWSVLIAPLVVIAALLLRGRWGYHAGKVWRLGIQWGVENLLGIRPKVIGLENMPRNPASFFPSTSRPGKR